MGSQHKFLFVVGVICTGLGVLIYINRNAINDKFDYRTELQLLGLDPVFRKKMRKFLRACRKEGMDVRLIEGWRSCERQNKLYAQGRTTPGKVVTNARCGQSAHNYKSKGIGAGDVYEFRDGKILFENPNWDRIGQIAVASGLEWGGNWKSFKDRPHVQDLNGYTVRQLYAKYQQTGKLAA